jgi:hypothetical protein
LILAYKYTPSGNDSALVYLNFKKNGSTINSTLYFLRASATYQQKKFPVSLLQTPDTVILSFLSSAPQNTAVSFIGSDLKIDDIYFKSQAIITGDNRLTDEDNVIIYPNPSDGRFRVLSREGNIKNLEVYNISGDKVYVITNLRQQINEIDLSGLEKGIYFLKISEAEKVYTKKILIK